MKKIITLAAICLGFTASAQQININSQYIFNQYLLNPGATGSKDYVPVQLNFRKQWAAFEGAPTTQFLTAHGRLAKKMGIGGILFNDVSGPSRRTGIQISTAYHLQIDKNNDHRIGMGLGLNLTQHFIDYTELTTYLPEDPAVVRGINNQLVPDANVGFFYHYKDKGFVGVSAYNLSELRRDLYDFNELLYNPLVRTYYFSGGYNFDLGKKARLNTAALGQLIEAGPFQWEVTVVGEFYRAFWIGASYRHNDAVVGLIGGQAGPFKFGYSYDYTISDIANYSQGSHEVFLELQIGRKDANGSKLPWLKRNRIFSPKIQ